METCDSFKMTWQVEQPTTEQISENLTRIDLLLDTEYNKLRPELTSGAYLNYKYNDGFTITSFNVHVFTYTINLNHVTFGYVYDYGLLIYEQDNLEHYIARITGVVLDNISDGSVNYHVYHVNSALATSREGEWMAACQR